LEKKKRMKKKKEKKQSEKRNTKKGSEQNKLGEEGKVKEKIASKKILVH
jgi:hypothetical protein